MKICPRCQKNYSDDNLNFCLEDGTVLADAGIQPDTIRINQPRVTLPQNPANAFPSGVGAQWRGEAPQGQPHTIQPKRSSKAWVWVLLILGAVFLLCGGGFIGFLALIGSQANDAANLTSANRGNPLVATTPSANPGQTALPTSGRSDLTTVDLDIFVKEFSAYGTTDLSGGELTMGAKQKGYYYVLVAPDDYKTEDADTRVTLRNIAAASGSLGYGLIFHSDTTPLQQGYAFLIDTKRKKYRVVHHNPQKEASVISWTTSNAIMEGTAENTLEVRDTNDGIDLYINGTKVNTIQNEFGYAGGVVGLYAGDGIKIAFKDLEIRK